MYDYCEKCGKELIEEDLMIESDFFSVPTGGIQTFEKVVGYICPQCGHYVQDIDYEEV